MTIQVCVCHGVDGGVGFAAKCASQSADATSTLMQLKVRNARNVSVSEIREGRKLATRGSPVLLRRTSTNLGKHLPGLAWRTSSRPRAHTYRHPDNTWSPARCAAAGSARRARARAATCRLRSCTGVCWPIDVEQIHLSSNAGPRIRRKSRQDPSLHGNAQRNQIASPFNAITTHAPQRSPRRDARRGSPPWPPCIR